MAKITFFQLKELKREVWYQIQRIQADLALMPRKKLPGMQKSLNRFRLLMALLNGLESDGVLELADDDGSEAALGGDRYENRAGESVNQPGQN